MSSSHPPFIKIKKSTITSHAKYQKYTIKIRRAPHVLLILLVVHKFLMKVLRVSIGTVARKPALDILYRISMRKLPIFVIQSRVDERFTGNRFD